MDDPVAAQCPLRGKILIKAVFTQIQHVLFYSMSRQGIRHNADDPPAFFQAGILGRLIRAPGISGNQCQPLKRRLA